MVLCTSESPPLSLSILEPPMESTSSIKMRHGECYLAITNNSLTILAPSPMYFYTSSLPDTLIKVQSFFTVKSKTSGGGGIIQYLCCEIVQCDVQ